jgi:restriction system protein
MRMSQQENAFFAGTHVQAQVKRWRHTVGSIEINSFRGALSTTAKGVFVSTGYFTKAAVQESGIATKPAIALIDGRKLAVLCENNGLLS